MVDRARAELELDSATETAVVERALNAYLLGRLLDVTQARAGLSEQEAEHVVTRSCRDRQQQEQRLTGLCARTRAEGI